MDGIDPIQVCIETCNKLGGLGKASFSLDSPDPDPQLCFTFIYTNQPLSHFFFSLSGL